MNTQYFFPPESLCNPGVSFNSLSMGSRLVIGPRTRPPRLSASNSLFVWAAMRVSRARWFMFLRRVFHYQNSSRTDLRSNPFNSVLCMMLELLFLLVQIGVSSFTLAVSKQERPGWPMRVWIFGYNIGCILSVLLLYGRCRFVSSGQGDSFGLSDLEQQRGLEDHRTLHLMNRCRTSLELFFAIWFVMGIVWMFDSRFGSVRRASKLHMLCVFLLVWNAISYLFPFLLFILLCCLVPLISTLLGYNMNIGSVDKAASEDQISKLPSWHYKEAEQSSQGPGNCAELNHDDPECCICLSKYREKDEVRQLPCSHLFHQKCVDQWLRIISCCPLCKQELER